MQNPPYSRMKKKAVVEETVPTVTINSVKVQSLIDAHLFYTGKVSQRQYEWQNAGDTVFVLEEDVPELLSKRLGGNTCCGSDPSGNKIFQLVVEV